MATPKDKAELLTADDLLRLHSEGVRGELIRGRLAEAASVKDQLKARTQTKLLTADDLLRLHSEGVRGELIRGVFCETMSAGEEHGEIAGLLFHFLISFVRPRRLGRLILTDVGVRLERGPDTVREPDIAFISYAKRPRGERNPGYVQVPPDLVVEVVSPNDRLAGVNDKARMWLSYDVPLVWVVYPNLRVVEVHQPDASVVTLTEDDTLDGGEVLPGFTCSVRDIFDL